LKERESALESCDALPTRRMTRESEVSRQQPLGTRLRKLCDKRIAKAAAAAGLHAERFERASTHWMRHTFVRHALVDGVAIEVVSELAGHASIATTSIYSSQELARKIGAINGVRRRTVSNG
jgi:site-specific recombinase XerD